MAKGFEDGRNCPGREKVASRPGRYGLVRGQYRMEDALADVGRASDFGTHSDARSTHWTFYINISHPHNSPSQ